MDNLKTRLKTSFNLGLLLLLLVSLPVSVYLAQQQQELRQRAQTAPIDYYGKQIETFGLFGQKDIASATRNKVGTDGMYHASGVIVDRSSTPNKIYAVDSGNSRILGFNGLNGVGPATPDIVIGQPDFNHGNCNGDSNLGTNGNPTASILCLMDYPAGNNTAEQWGRNNIEVDSLGNLYVPDAKNNRVLRFNQPFSPDKSSGKGDAVADFVWGQNDFNSNLKNGGSILGPVNAPNNHSLFFTGTGGSGEGTAAGVSVDPSGNVWITDAYNNRVLRFPPGSKNADLVIGKPDFQTRGCGGGTSLTSLCVPVAVRIHPQSGELFVLENYPSPFKARFLVYRPPFTNGMAAYKTIIPQNGPYTNWGGLNGDGSYIFQATGFSFNPYKVGAYAAGDIWVNELSANSTLLIDFNGNIIKVIGAKDKNQAGGDSQYGGSCGSIYNGNHLWSPGGSIGFDSQNNIYLADEVFHTIFRYALPYDLQSNGCLPDANGVLVPKGGNKSSPDTLGESVGVAVFDDQLIVGDEGRKYKVWNNYKQRGLGEAADYVLFEPRGLWLSDGIDDGNRLWTLGEHGQIQVYQLPFTSSSNTPMADWVKLYWADDGQEIPGGGGTMAFDKINKALYILQGARILRVRNYADVSTGGRLLVDMVLGQRDKATNVCNQGLSAPNAETICNPGQIKFDRAGNLYVVDNYWECHGNQRVTVFTANDLTNATGMFPMIQAKVVFQAPNFNSKGTCAYSVVNAPGTPVTVAFNSKNQLVIGNDGYYGDISQREKKQLWFYSDPLRKQTPDASIDLYMGTPGDMTFDKDDNFIIQDHTWYRTTLINLCNDPEWLSWLPGVTPVSACFSGTTPPIPTPTPTIGGPGPSPTPTPPPTLTSGPSCLPSGLVSYWKLDENTGQIVGDSFDSNPGTRGVDSSVSSDDPSWTAGKIGSALNFNGSQRAVVPDSNSLDLGNAFSVSSWIKRGGGLGNVQGIVSKGATPGSAYFVILDTDNTFALVRGNVAIVARSSVTITDTTSWHHVAATKNGSSAKIYVDGTDVTVPLTDSTFNDTNSPLNIGAETESGSPRSFFNGSIDEVGIWNRALTSSEVSQLYNGGAGLTCPSSTPTPTSVAGPTPTPIAGSIITADAGIQGNALNSSTLTGSLTVNSNSNRYLLVGVATRKDCCPPSVSSINYGSQGLSLIGVMTDGYYQRVELWGLTAPATGINTLTINMSGSSDVAFWARNFVNVSQTTPFGTFSSSSGGGLTPFSNVSSATNELVVDALSFGNFGLSGNIATVGSGQTQISNTGGGVVKIGGSYESGQTSVTMSWTLSVNANWAIGAIPLKPATPTPISTPTPTPPLTGPTPIPTIHFHY